MRGERTFVTRCFRVSALDGEQQLVRVALGLAAELATVVGEHGADGDANVLVEGQHAVVHQVARRVLQYSPHTIPKAARCNVWPRRSPS